MGVWTGARQRWRRLELWAALAALLLVLAPGCMKKSSAGGSPYADEGYGYGYGPAADYAESEAPSAMLAESVVVASRAPARKSAGAPAAPPAPPPPPPPPGARSSGAGAPPEAPAPAPAGPARMVHYTGFAQLRVEKVDESVDRISALAKSMGGFVERAGGGSISVRVPVKRFDEAFKAVLGQGEVLDKNVSAQDVTEAFTSVELRLKTLRNTQDRLASLLARSKDEAEKLMLVRELQRVGEEIDRLESASRTLSALAEMSRINVQLVGRQALAQRGPAEGSAAFRWIFGLSPFQPDVVRGGELLRMDAPAGMVALDERRKFIAESPEGARIWSGWLPNDPEGDGAFWADAIVGRIGVEFAKAERSELGGFQVLRLVDRGDRPYTWVLMVRAEGRRLELIEVYYPSAQVEERYQEDVKQAILSSFGGGA